MFQTPCGEIKLIGEPFGKTPLVFPSVGQKTFYLPATLVNCYNERQNWNNRSEVWSHLTWEMISVPRPNFPTRPTQSVTLSRGCHQLERENDAIRTGIGAGERESVKDINDRKKNSRWEGGAITNTRALTILYKRRCTVNHRLGTVPKQNVPKSLPKKITDSDRYLL